MTVIVPTARCRPARRCDNGAQWLSAVGGVALGRVVFDPLPGMVTEDDLLRFVKHDEARRRARGHERI